MSEWSYLLTSNYVSVMNLVTGEVTKITKDSPRFEAACNAVKDGRFEDVPKMTSKNVLINSSVVNGNQIISIRDGRVWYTPPGGQEFELVNEMTARVLKNIEDGFDAQPFVNFMTNLMSNPSSTAIKELYLFLEATELPITDDGHFIAYKMVRDDYTSIYDGKFENKVGTVVEMPRNMVDDKRENTCSQGLHFCSRKYLKSYGSRQSDNDRLLLVKINPADVVSIPSDYNNAKGRASKYLIWKDITEPGWREKYFEQDYNDSSVEVTLDDPDDWDKEHDDCLDDPQDYLEAILKQIETEYNCPDCGSNEYHSKGYVMRGGEWSNRRKCKACGKNYYVSKEIDNYD
jgi:predicted nucleic-acid-binding Zn-ribbon protein